MKLKLKVELNGNWNQKVKLETQMNEIGILIYEIKRRNDSLLYNIALLWW